MNYIQSLYCFLIQGRLKENQSVSDSPVTGNIVLSVSIILILTGVLFVLMAIVPDFRDYMEDIFDGRSGRTIGRLLVIGLLVLIYPIIHFTVGSQKNYMGIKKEFFDSPEEQREVYASKGKKLFFGSLIIFFIGMGLTFLSTLIMG